MAILPHGDSIKIDTIEVFRGLNFFPIHGSIGQTYLSRLVPAEDTVLAVLGLYIYEQGEVCSISISHFRIVSGIDRIKVQIDASCFKMEPSRTELKSNFTITNALIENGKYPGDNLRDSPLCRTGGHGLSSLSRPAEVYPPQVKIDVIEKPCHYLVNSELPGVELKNLQVLIEGRTLSLYAGITGEKQKNGKYRYAEEVVGKIKGEIMLPIQAYQRPETIEFDGSVLRLVFPKEIDEFLEQLVVI